MAFVIKAEVRDPQAEMFVFAEQMTMYGGKHIAEGGRGLIARGIVVSAEAVARSPGITRQTPRASVTVTRTKWAKQPLGRGELKSLTDWNDRQPGTELNFKLYRQATYKIVGISEEAATFLDNYL